MPPKSQKRSPDAADYGSDDGFVEDAPRPKKAKTLKGAASNVKKTPTKREFDLSTQTDDEGNSFWQLSSGRNPRRLTVSDYKGTTMIAIREYYDKDGKMLPGKKGITLPLEQFASIVSVLPDLESVLNQKGESLPRPNYEGTSAPLDNDDEETGDVPERENAASGTRKNFEATSDEEEEA